MNGLPGTALDTRSQSVKHRFAVAPCLEQANFAQDTQVVGEQALLDTEKLAELTDMKRAIEQSLDHRQAGAVGEGFEL